MANLFPNIYPTVWSVEWERYQDRDTSNRGFLQINSYDPVSQATAHAEWQALTRTEYDQIKDHWWVCAASSFSLFNFDLDKLRGLFVAVADGTSLIYTLPAKSVSGYVIKHNNVAAASQPTLLIGAGPEGEDQLQYASGTKPAAGVVLTIDAADAQQKFDANYSEVKFVGRHRESDLWIIEATFTQKVSG